MGLWAWLFPTDADHLARARRLMAEGRHGKAREILMRCSLPEAEKLYDECSAAIDKADLPAHKKRLADAGFHGWKIDVKTRTPRRARELAALVAEELEKAGIDLGLPDIDQTAFNAAVTRAQRRSRGNETGAVRLVPIVDEKLKTQLRDAAANEKPAPSK